MESCTRRIFPTLEEAIEDLPRAICLAKEVAMAEHRGEGTPRLSGVEMSPPDSERDLFPDKFVVTVRHVVL